MVGRGSQSTGLPPRSSRRIRPLRLGLVPLVDAAPLIVARDRGFFARYDLRVDLFREPGWATVRDKVIYGELDAAHAVAGMPVATTLGVGSIACECVAALVLNLHGNAITLSTKLQERGVSDAPSLAQILRQDRGEKTYTFGVVHAFSSHRYLLSQWLRSGRIDPDRDVRIVVVPPSQMYANLAAGNLDGYCVGEPWNSQAILAGDGWCAAVGADLAPGHPEKVLMMRRDWIEHHPEEHLRLVAALLEACAYCDAPENRDDLIHLLAERRNLNVPAAVLRRSLAESFASAAVRWSADDFHIFHRDGANEPCAAKAQWVARQLSHSGLLPQPDGIISATATRVFCPSLFHAARNLFEECSRPKVLTHAPTSTPSIDPLPTPITSNA